MENLHQKRFDKGTALKALVNIFRSIYHDLETNMIQKKIIIDLKSRQKYFWSHFKDTKISLGKVINCRRQIK